jgi:hypothetical protein
LRHENAVFAMSGLKTKTPVGRSYVCHLGGLNGLDLGWLDAFQVRTEAVRIPNDRDECERSLLIDIS